MSVDKRDSALSEVIGMILIIAILVAAMSVYVTYMVPEKGKASEIRHMNDVRGSFLELSYLIDSLWVNGQIHVPVTVPIRLHSTSEPTILPLFTPVSSQGVLSINQGDPGDRFTVQFLGFNEQRVFINPPPSDQIEHGVLKTLSREPYKVLLNFTPLLSPTRNIPKSGILATLNGVNSGVNFSVQLHIRNFIEDTTVIPGSDDETISLASRYRHSLVAIDTKSGLEYVVVHDLGSNAIEVDIKPVLDLFPGATLVKGSQLEFNPIGGLPNPAECVASNPDRLSCDMKLTFSYGLKLGVDIPAERVNNVTVSASSSFSDLTFVSRNYYWVNQEFQYQKGAVFLIQDYLIPGSMNRVNSTPLSDAQIRVANTTSDDPVIVSVVDIDLRQKSHSRLSSSGGSAQVIAEISEIENRLRDGNTNIWYNVADGTANAAVFRVESDDPDTLRIWFNMFGRVCGIGNACNVASPPGSGQVTLTVSYGERVVVQYTKVGVDMEIRP